jgi:hypothetical protein
MAPAAIRFMVTNPYSGLTPTRKAAEPPAVPMSASEWPAKAWPRITVNVPTTPETMATTPPTIKATCTGELEKNPGSKTGARDPVTISPYPA